MEALLQQNKDMNEKISKLQEENENMRRTQEATDERVLRNVKSLQEANESVKKTLEDMVKIKDRPGSRQNPGPGQNWPVYRDPGPGQNREIYRDSDRDSNI